MDDGDLEGVVQDTTGDVIFNVRFAAVAFRPQQDEVLNGIVTNIDHQGITVYSGPLVCYIKQDVSALSDLTTLQRMPGYEFD